MNSVRICWRRALGVYRADCRCGETSEHPKLTEAERWALAHHCPSVHTFTATVFDVFADQTVDTRNPPAVTTWHVAASGPAGHVGWDTTGTPPAKDTTVTVTVTEGES